MSDIVAVDFFCGIGGLTRGLRAAGIKVLCGIDLDSTAEQTFKKNNRGMTFLDKDISDINGRNLLRDLKINRKKTKLLFAGCAPWRCRLGTSTRQGHRASASEWSPAESTGGRPRGPVPSKATTGPRLARRGF